MATLYELAEQYKLLIDLLDTTEPDEIDESVNNAVDALDDKIQNKIDSIVKVIKEFKMLELARKEEAKRISERATHAKNVHARLISYLQEQILVVAPNTKKFKSDSFDIAIVKNGGLPPIEFDPDVQIPIGFCDTIQKPNNDRIRHHLNRGHVLKFAKFTERGTHVRIK